MKKNKIILDLLGIYANVSVVSAGVYFLWTRYNFIESLILKVMWFVSVGIIYSFLILVFLSIFDEYWVELIIDMKSNNKPEIYQRLVLLVLLGAFMLLAILPILVGILQ